MTIIRILTPSKEIATRLDAELRAQRYQAAPSGVHVSTDAPRSTVEKILNTLSEAK